MANYGRDYLFAQIASQSYKDNPSPIHNWVVVDKMIDPSTGFAACAYKNPQTNEVVIAYRGTDGLDKDGSPDGALARDSKAMWMTGPTLLFAATKSDWDIQFTQGLDFAARVKGNNPDSKISVTGHSLGGGLAQISAKMYGFSGVTFDPAAAKNVVESKQFKEYAKAHGIPETGRGSNNEPHNYEVKGSPISGATGRHVGRGTEITGFHADGRAVGSYDVLGRHSMERIEGVFASAALKGELPKVAIPDPELTPFVPKFASNDPNNLTNPAVEALKERVTDKTIVAVSGLCDKVGFTDDRIRGNLCYGMTDIALNADFTGKGTITAGLNGNNITLVEERSVGDRSYAMGDSAVIGNIDQAISQANIAAFKPSEQILQVDQPALAQAVDSPSKARTA